MDRLGASGNGDAWYAPLDAAITDHPLYLKYSKSIAGIDATDLKTEIGSMPATVEAAPILNYLRWVLALRISVE